jgi:hypothetical protein
MSSTQFARIKTISLETYKKNGSPVRSPVWVVEDNGLLYVRSDPDSWKVKRIRRNSSVRLAPSNMRGIVKGDWVKGEAHFAGEQQRKRILGLFNKKYGIMIRILNFFNRLTGRRNVTVIAIKV